MSSDAARNTNLPNKVLHSFVAGALAGTVAATVTCPLEVIKTRLQGATTTKMRAGQMWMHIMRTEGVRGLFRGLPANLLGVGPARAVYFAAYRGSKTLLDRQGIRGTSQHLIAAIMASVTQSTATSPIWVIKTRMQLQEVGVLERDRYRGLWDAAVRIWKAEGMMGFYRGLGASYLGTVETVIQFVVYERLKEEYAAMYGQMGNLMLFVTGAAAKLAASSLSYPHEVVRTRLRELDPAGRPLYKGIMHCVQESVAKEGIRSLYGGIGIHLLRSVPNAAILFLVVEMVTGKI